MSEKNAGGRPNVLLVCVDDMNPWMGCLREEPFSHPQIQTPCLDRLAEGATVFTHAQAPAPICNPARTAIFTGMHPTSSGIYGNYCWWRPSLEGVKSLPEFYRANGYFAAGSGKVLHHCIGFNPPEQWDDYQDQVFDDTWDRKNRVNYPHIEPGPAPEGYPFHGMDYSAHEFDWGPLPIEEKDYGDMRVVDYAKDFLGREHGKPFFLACGFFHPHVPWYAPQRFFDLYDPKEIEVPGELRKADWDLIPEKGKALASVGPQDRDQYDQLIRHGRLGEALCAYMANISFADFMIGGVLDALEKSSHADNTVVAFYGDHGFHVGEKRHFGKQALWRESTHVPLIVKEPGARGRKVRSAVSTLDIGPTLAELCGLEAPEYWDGQSLVSAVRGEAGNNAEHAVVCSFHEGNHAVISKDYRYIIYEDGGEELYDLQADPLELHNMMGEAGTREIADGLRTQIPARIARAAPGLEAFDFDWRNYTWTRKAGLNNSPQ